MSVMMKSKQKVKLATLQQILMKIQNSMDYFKQNTGIS